MYGRVATWSDRRPVAIVAGGKSLAGFDIGRLQGLARIIAVKGSMFDAPFADCGIGIDWPRFQEWMPRIGSLPFPVYWTVSQRRLERQPTDLPANVTLLDSVASYEVSTDPAFLHTGGTSGFAALNLAVLHGAKDIVLFGYDYTPDNDVMRHNDRHYGEHRRQRLDLWANWSRSYGIVAEPLRRLGISVLNASPKSAITAFPRCSLEQAVEHLDRVRPA